MKFIEILVVLIDKLVTSVIKTKNALFITVTTFLIIFLLCFFLYTKYNSYLSIKKKNRDSPEFVIKSSLVIDTILLCYLEKYKYYGVTAVALFQYHNGTYYKSNVSMLKSSLTNVKVINTYEQHWDFSKLQNIPLSSFGGDFYDLIENDICYFQNDNENLSFQTQNRLYNTKTKTAILILVKIESNIVGNLCIYFDRKITYFDINELKKISKQISFELYK